MAPMFPNTVREDNIIGNAFEANTLGVSIASVVELSSQTSNSSKKAPHKKNRVESPKESNITMLVKVLLQDRVDYKKQRQEDKEDWKHWMNEVVPNIMVGIAGNTFINVATQNAALLAMIAPFLSKS